MSFIASVIVLGLVAWAGALFIYRHRIQSLEHRLQLRDDQIAAYKRQLAGMAHQGRTLTEEQRSAIADVARSVPLGLCRLHVVYPPSFPEAALFADEIASALREGGWAINADQTGRTQRLRERGLNLVVPNLGGRGPEIMALGKGLKRARLVFNWVEEPGFDWDGVLYVDRGDD